ncbi:MAG: 2'-5' RNA ligase family protein [Ferruginibacter sp.]
MTDKIRRQLTLFLEQNDAEIIEKVRQLFNPRQFELINAHITLCREDEIENIEQVILNISELKESEIIFQLGKPKRFDEGNGVYIKIQNGGKKFNNLRQELLRGVINNPREQIPHITLMHPKNSICTDDNFEKISNEKFPASICFKKIYLIGQNYDEKWNVIKLFNL